MRQTSWTLSCLLTWLSLKSVNVNFHFEAKYSLVVSLLHLDNRRVSSAAAAEFVLDYNTSELLLEGEEPHTNTVASC